MWRNEFFKRFTNKILTQNNKEVAQRELTTATPLLSPEKYSTAVSTLHWLIAAAALPCVGFVLAAQRTKDDATKGKYMNLHKSLGLTVGALMVPRVGIRLLSRAPAPLPGSPIEQTAGKVSHVGLYLLLLTLPSTGIAMGYFGGRGVPFFSYHIEGAAEAERKPQLAKTAYQVHKYAGVVLEYFIPLHLLGAAYHTAKGQKIFSRINPFN